MRAVGTVGIYTGIGEKQWTLKSRTKSEKVWGVYGGLLGISRHFEHRALRGIVNEIKTRYRKNESSEKVRLFVPALDAYEYFNFTEIFPDSEKSAALDRAKELNDD